MNDDTVVIENLVKFYGGRCVLDGINLKVPRSCIYGLLGRNGSGKTTIIRILMGLDFATRGKTYLLGTESEKLTPQIKGRVGYVAEGHNLIQDYTVGRLAKLCKDLSLKWNDELFNNLIEKFRLPMNRKVRQLSMGMRAQLNLALALAPDAELLLLDDPTLGLDTVARREFLELAVDILQKDGRSIVFCSHILGDVERIADRIGILTGGKLAVDCSLDELKKRVKKLRLTFEQDAPKCLHLTEIINQQIDNREMVLTIANYNEQKQAIIDTFRPQTCTEVPMSLEDIFIECTRPPSITESANERNFVC
jgi:ABC-2 type transport system ATP-binding protein